MTRTTWHCHIAVSLDGKIARPDGSFDWLMDYPPQEFGIDAFLAEVDAVVMELTSKARPNEPHVLDDWTSGTNSEQRRVLYVGVSRARRVLVLVVPTGRKQQLLDLLTGADVPFDVTAAAR